MNREALRALLEDVRAGRIGVDDALARLESMPYEDLGFARLDHHRALRTGAAEAVYCEGKTAAQVVEILDRMGRHHPVVLGTRVSPELAREVLRRVEGARYNELARAIVVERAGVATAAAQPDAASPAPSTSAGQRPRPAGGADPPLVLVCAAGTSDLPVAEEAALTAEVMGSRVERLWDVGVAGLHRLLAHREDLARAAVVVAVAGMEGALPSVVAGLTPAPVIAVPTSVGYGASLGGLAALLTMINSCAPGLSVVNIDNGFGAGALAHRIAARMADRPAP